MPRKSRSLSRSIPALTSRRGLRRWAPLLLLLWLRHCTEPPLPSDLQLLVLLLSLPPASLRVRTLIANSLAVAAAVRVLRALLA